MKLVKPILLASILLLAACNETATPYTKEKFEYDGCDITYVNHPRLPNFYIARCGDQPTTTETHLIPNGKTSTLYSAITVESSDELRKRLAVAEAREKAIAKLSPEEKSALGIK